LKKRGAAPVIPNKQIRRVQIEMHGAFHPFGARVERCFNYLRGLPHAAMRYDKLVESFAGIVSSFRSG
jgi:hypothetical protein